jgi:hypothetical protein
MVVLHHRTGVCADHRALLPLSNGCPEMLYASYLGASFGNARPLQITLACDTH